MRRATLDEVQDLAILKSFPERQSLLKSTVGIPRESYLAVASKFSYRLSDITYNAHRLNRLLSSVSETSDFQSPFTIPRAADVWVLTDREAFTMFTDVVWFATGMRAREGSSTANVRAYPLRVRAFSDASEITLNSGEIETQYPNSHKAMDEHDVNPLQGLDHLCYAPVYSDGALSRFINTFKTPLFGADPVDVKLPSRYEQTLVEKGCLEGSKAVALETERICKEGIPCDWRIWIVEFPRRMVLTTEETPPNAYLLLSGNETNIVSWTDLRNIVHSVMVALMLNGRTFTDLKIEKPKLTKYRTPKTSELRQRAWAKLGVSAPESKYQRMKREKESPSPPPSKKTTPMRKISARARMKRRIAERKKAERKAKKD